jgi:hypothetical protein
MNELIKLIDKFPKNVKSENQSVKGTLDLKQMAELFKKIEGSTFCDVGASDGRMLLIVCMLPQIKRVYGIELDKDDKDQHKLLVKYIIDNITDKETFKNNILKIRYFTYNAFTFDKHCFYSEVDVLYTFDGFWPVFGIGLRSILYNFRNIKLLIYSSTSLVPQLTIDDDTYVGDKSPKYASENVLLMDRDKFDKLEETYQRVTLLGPTFYYMGDNIVCKDIDFTQELNNPKPEYKQITMGKNNIKYNGGGNNVAYGVNILELKWKNEGKRIPCDTFKENELMVKIVNRIYPLIYLQNSKMHISRNFLASYCNAPSIGTINMLIKNIDHPQLRQIYLDLYNSEDINTYIVPAPIPIIEEKEEIPEPTKKRRITLTHVTNPEPLEALLEFLDID